ncbi:hypothetical protein [Methylotenera sp.]|uniref:hypothetical protein n=1 Tax=Methylotenera sp. TaxID=2051956 RepID=UPI0024885C5C|nr:hypothetical protein [Methylotenera sp.]MDI1361095.1 hypothetical protein [Methylotenera sp.]
MSLLLVNQVLAVLGTDSVAVVRRTLGLRRRIVDQKQVHFPKQIDNSNAEVVIWQPAINQLDILINTMKVKPKSKLDITLASEFVRYLALPPQPLYMNTAEKIAYATAAYREIYGSVVDEWEVRLQDTAMHDTTIVAAIDKRLLETLNQVALKYQLKLITVKPYLMSAFNKLTKQIGRSSGYLVIVEFKRLLLINLQQGKCVNVRMFNLGSDWQAELKSLMVRESVLSESNTSDNKSREILVYAPVQKNIVINSIDGWQLKRINTLNKLSNYHFAMLEAAL